MPIRVAARVAAWGWCYWTWCTVIEGLCEPSNELRIAFWFQMLEQKLRMSLEVLEVSFRARWKKRLRILILQSTAHWHRTYLVVDTRP